MTFPVTTRFFADSFTFWLRCLAVSYAMRLFAHGNAFRTIEHFTSFVWAFYLTLWLFAFHVANCIPGLGAGSVAARRLAHRITNSRTVWVVAFPRTLRVTS